MASITIRDVPDETRDLLAARARTQAVRRLVAAGALTEAEGSEAVRGLLAWPITLVDFAPMAARVWELGETVSAYDAWSVALAEAAAVPLVTLDARLARAPGPRCTFNLGPAT